MQNICRIHSDPLFLEIVYIKIIQSLGEHEAPNVLRAGRMETMISKEP